MEIPPNLHSHLEGKSLAEGKDNMNIPSLVAQAAAAGHLGEKVSYGDRHLKEIILYACLA